MENQLRDIKPLLEIPDSSYAIYFSVVLFLIFILLTSLFFLIRKIIINRRETLAQQQLKELKEVDWNDSKTAAYSVTILGKLLVNDRRSEEIYNQILPLLEQYKYKKEVPPVDVETLKQYRLLVHILDESI